MKEIEFTLGNTEEVLISVSYFDALGETNRIIEKRLS